MSGMHLSEDRLIDLARDLVPPHERDGLIAHIEACAACEARFLATCREAELLELRGLPPALRAQPRRGFVWAAAAAAAILAAALLGGAFLRQRGDDLEPWLPVDSERVMLRSLPSTADNEAFLEALEAYARHDSGRVVELLRGRALPPQYEFLGLFLASAQVRENDCEAALATLERLDIDTLPQPYRDRARWERYLALKHVERGAEARELLTLLASHPGELRDRAEAELSRTAEAPAR